MSRIILSAGLVALLGCGDGSAGGSGSDDDTGTPPPTPDTSTTAADETSGSGNASSSLDSTGTTAAATTTDDTTAGGSDTLGPGGSSSDSTSSDTGTPPPADGCPIDILFVVENGFLMDVNQVGLTNAIVPFLDDLNTELPEGVDLHVGIARGTGFYTPGNSGGIADFETCIPNPDGNFAPPTESSTGVNGQQGRLYEHMGMNFFEFQTGDDPLDLGIWFHDAMQGALSNSPHPESGTVTTAAAYAFHPVNAGTNTGFIRSDAVLLMFLVSQFTDMTPAEIPVDESIQLVRDAKADCGGDDCIVTGGVFGQLCYDNPTSLNTRLYDFMNGFSKPPGSITTWNGGSAVNYGGDVLGATLAAAVGNTCGEIANEMH